MYSTARGTSIANIMPFCPSVSGADPLRAARHEVGVGDVARIHLHARAASGPLLLELAQERLAPRDQPEVRTRARVVVGEPLAEARARTGDEEASDVTHGEYS